MGTGTWGRWARVGLEMGSGGEGETGLGGLGRRGRGGWGAIATGRPLTPDRVRGRLQPSPQGEGLRRPEWLGDGEAGTAGSGLDGVVEEGVPAVGVDVADEAADVGDGLLGEEEGHDLAAHGASGEE